VAGTCSTVVRRDGGTDIDLLSGLDGRDRFDGGEAGGTLLGGAIDPGDVDANTVRAGDQNFNFIGAQAFHGKEGELGYLIFELAGVGNESTIVSGEINGDRVADFEIEIVGLLQLAASDFLP
jgi:hypothetical protein